MRVYKFLSLKFGLKSLGEKRLKISALDDLNDLFDLVPYEMTDKQRRKAFRIWQLGMAKKFGVLCFSSEWCDPVIWAHYSDKHRGLCLGFDLADGLGRRVEYVDKRLAFPASRESLTGEALLYTKYANWAYEKEVRCFAQLDKTSQSSDGLYFMDFATEMKLVEVIAGARCPVSERKIREALRPLEEVVLIKARAGFHRFEIVPDQRGFTTS